MRKVFGIGLSRTGTSSLATALTYLGYKSLHFPSDDVTRTEIHPFFSNPPPSLTLTALRFYDALTDTPICLTYRALDKGYPRSRFILTVREKDSWLASCRHYWQKGLIADLEHAPNAGYRNFVRLINERVYGTAEFGEEIFSQAYDTHVSQVNKFFSARKDDLLTLDICKGDSWPRLCGFLEVPHVPVFPFPWENRRDGKNV